MCAAAVLATFASATLWASAPRPSGEGVQFDDPAVWTITETRRILRHEPAESGAAVSLTAARNEWEGFQILLRSATPVTGVTIEAGDLVGLGGVSILADDARLYRAHQVEITEGSWRNWDFVAGWYPDALIPFRHPLTREPLAGGELAAVPFDLPANETHGFWVDIHAPPGVPAGGYFGSYTVRSGAATLATIPVSLTVWDFDLPATPTLPTEFGSPKDLVQYYYELRESAGIEPQPSDWNAVKQQCMELVSRHRINAFPPRDIVVEETDPNGAIVIPTGDIDALRDFIDTYHVNAVRMPTHTRWPGWPRNLVELVVGHFGEGRLPEFMAAWDAAIQQLDRPEVLFYTYLWDEPNDEASYDYVRYWGSAVRSTGTSVNVLVVEQTLPDPNCGGDLYGAVDIWCPHFYLYDPNNAHVRQSLGERIWTYTALCSDPYTPKWQTDFPLVNYRIPAWIAWRYDIQGLLYWQLAYWLLNYDLPPDPWTDPKTYENEWQGQTYIFNGDGCLLYPGRKVGYEGVVPSMRLKALRDSIDDYEYLAILEQMGLETEAKAIVMPLAGSWLSWSGDPAAYEAAREVLAQMIMANRPPRPGDLDCDGQVDFGDINPFVLALVEGEAAYGTHYPHCQYINADCSGNGEVGFGDINPFVALLLR